MPRRSSRKTEIDVLAVESVQATVTPKKGRRAGKVETQSTEIEVITKTETISPAKSKKPSKPKQEVDSDDDLLVTPRKTSLEAKANGVTAKKNTEEEHDAKPKKAPTKRKAKIDEDDDGEEKKAPKKRKTKEEKEAEAMPVAARTLVGSLKKAMHIGAHVSGAGGESLENPDENEN